MELKELSASVGTHYGPTRIHRAAAMHAGTNDCYCATAPLDRQTYNAGYIHMEIEAPRPWCAGSNDPDLRCRGSDEVC